MATDGDQPERWWNALIEIRIPFATEEGAREALSGDATTDRLFDIFGSDATITGRIEEAVEGIWPF